MQTQNTQRKCIMTRRARGARHLIYDGVLTGRLLSAAFLPALSHQLLIILEGSTERGCATPALTLHAKSTPAAKIITDHCLSPVPQLTVTVCTQTAVYAEMCSTWQRRLTAARTMPKVGVVGGG